MPLKTVSNRQKDKSTQAQYFDSKKLLKYKNSTIKNIAIPINDNVSFNLKSKKT